MKRQKGLAILLGMILMIGWMCPVQAEEQLPAEIKTALAGMEITKTASWEGPGGTWFILIRTPEGMNVLLCFELQDGRWLQRFQTSAAVPQGEAGVKRLLITDQVRDFVYDCTWLGPILMILTDDGGYTGYQRSDAGQWNLFKAFYLDEQVHLDFDEASITYRTPIDQDHDRFETVQGSFERDLTKVDINTIPRSPQQARELLKDAQSQSGNENQP